MTIFFGTTNEGKLREARSVLDIEIEGTPLEVEEIQSLDPIKVATQKAFDYFAKLNKPVLIEDVSLTFHALGQLPGTYINDFTKSLGNDGLIKLLGENRKATVQTTLAFCQNNTVEIFIGKTEGSISLKQMGPNGFGFDPIFIPAGQKKTYAQMTDQEKNKFSMRTIALSKLKLWLDKQK